MSTTVHPVLQLQRTIGNRAVQRLLEGVSEGASADAERDSLATFRASLEKRRGLGVKLPEDARATLEPRIGADLRKVRIHSGPEASDLSTAVQARAFTTGSDIFFKEGAYDPHSPSGLQLLAHEITHTVQQSEGPVAGSEVAEGVSISDPSDAFEQEAEQVAEHVSDHKTVAEQRIPAKTQSVEAGGNASVQREGEDNDPFNVMPLIQARIALQTPPTAGGPSAAPPSPVLNPRPNDVGNVAPYNKQPRAGRDAQGNLLTQNEHGMPNEQLKLPTTNPLTGESDYTNKMYRRDTTLRWEMDAALHKTHGNRGGVQADNPQTKRLQEKAARGEPINYREDIFLPRLQQMLRSRDATGSRVTDIEISNAFLGQDGNLFALKTPEQAGQTVKSLGSTVDDVSIEEYNPPSVAAQNSSPLAPENSTPAAGRNSSPLVSEDLTPAITQNSSPLVPENSTPAASENASPLVSENAAPLVSENVTSAAPESSTSVATEPAAPDPAEGISEPAGGSSAGSKVIGGAATGGMILGGVRDLYEGNYEKAAMDTSKNALMTYGLSKVPALMPLVMMKSVIDADTPEVHKESQSWAEAHDPGDHTVAGGVMAAGAEVADSAYKGVVKPMGTDIGEGLAAAYLWLTGANREHEEPHVGAGSYSDEYVSGQ